MYEHDRETSNSYNYDLERGQRLDSYGQPVYVQPKKYAKFQATKPQEDYMNWSTTSLFVCFIWGILAFIASNKVRKYNKMEAYDEAAYYSQAALRHNRSAVACCIIMVIIIGVPLALSLAVQGSAYKFPNARLFFG